MAIGFNIGESHITSAAVNLEDFQILRVTTHSIAQYRSLHSEANLSEKI